MFSKTRLNAHFDCFNAYISKLKAMKIALSLLLSLLFAGMSFAQNGLNFDGSNDIVLTGFSGVLGSNNRTFEAWVFVSTSAPSSNLTILDYGLNAVGSRNTFVVSGSRALGFLSGGTNANLFSSSGDVPVGQWAHVAFVLNSGTGFLYVNGTQVATGNLTTVNTPSGNQNVNIGQRVPGGSIRFNGSIDEVRIWNVARSAAEINAFKDVEFCSNPAGLVAYYKMNEGIAGGSNVGITTTLDEISANNGFLNSFALNGATSNFVTGAALTTSYSSSQTLDGCDGYSVTIGGNTYDSTGVYTDTLAATLTGCDSVVTTTLTINSANAVTQTLSECPGFAITVDTNTYTTTGVYVDTLTSVLSGCDSIVTTDLTINSVDTVTQVLNECAGFSVTVGTNTYVSTGIYVDSLMSVVTGCDSVVTTDLTIDTLDISTSVSGIVITAGQSGVTYAWIDCDNGNSLIQGETAQSFTPTSNGNYAVIVDNGVCTDTSACVPVTVVGIDHRETNTLKVFPVPAMEAVTIQWKDMDHFSISIFNAMGQKFSQTDSDGATFRLDISDFPSGVYYVELEKEGKKLRRKFVKL